MKRKNVKFLVSTLAILALLLTLALPAWADFNTTTVDSAGIVGAASSLALNAAGHPVISYWDTTNGNLKVAVCGNVTCTTGNTLTTVDNSGAVGQATSLVLNAAGNPVIAYLDQFNFILNVAVCGNPTCTAGNTLTPVDASGDVGRYISLALNAAGNPVISYWDQTNLDLKVAVCGNATCTAGNTLTIVDGGAPSFDDVGEYTSLALNAAGHPVISYYDATNLDLKVAVCGNATCTTGNTLTTVDSTGLVGQDTSLVLNAAGRPVISYRRENTQDLKVAICGDATCTAGDTLTTVDSTGVVGFNTSLELTAAGNPVISYLDQTNLNLKVAVCGNATCTTGNTLTTVDSTGGTRGGTSLELTAGGSPVISYADFTNFDLKVTIDIFFEFLPIIVKN